jgi:uncharacterized protein (DUF2147 family)
MILRNCTQAYLIGALLGVTAATSASAADPTGDWRVEDGVATIRVAECQGSMWGAVAWEKTPGGKDKYNPDPSKAGRPTLGMPILLDMKKQPNAESWKGIVYNAKDGKSYESTITPVGTDQLKIQGCVLGFLCGGETWTRVGPPIPSSPANAPKGAKMTPAKSAPAPAAAPPSSVSQPARTSAGAKPAGDIGDICLLPDLARLPH